MLCNEVSSKIKKKGCLFAGIFASVEDIFLYNLVTAVNFSTAAL